MGALTAYNVNPDTVTVAGISAGAFMAVQLQVAYSASVHGAAIVAGGPYDCEQGNLLAQGVACSTGFGLPAVSTFVDYTNTEASAGAIDPVSNIAGKPIYLFSGKSDSVINQAVMNELVLYWGAFTTVQELTYNSTTQAEHAWISPDATHSCGTLASPYLNNCSFDMEQDFLTLFYGTLAPRTSSPGGTYLQFDQNTFCPSSNCSNIVMDTTGWLYVPTACSQGEACKLLVMLHGCEQNQATVGTVLVHESGLNEWADSNNILVLYPQSSSSSADPDACWDFTGYTGANYALKSAPQMTAIMSMVQLITSGAQ
jgi:poly(3-hydroxybutyrate) depolymerase